VLQRFELEYFRSLYHLGPKYNPQPDALGPILTGVGPEQFTESGHTYPIKNGLEKT